MCNSSVDFRCSMFRAFNSFSSTTLALPFSCLAHPQSGFPHDFNMVPAVTTACFHTQHISDISFSLVSLKSKKEPFYKSFSSHHLVVLLVEIQSCAHSWINHWLVYTNQSNSGIRFLQLQLLHKEGSQYLNKIEILLVKMKGRMDSGMTTNDIHLYLLCSEKLPCFFLKGTLHFVTGFMFDPTLTVESCHS